MEVLGQLYYGTRVRRSEGQLGVSVGRSWDMGERAQAHTKIAKQKSKTKKQNKKNKSRDKQF